MARGPAALAVSFRFLRYVRCAFFDNALLILIAPQTEPAVEKTGSQRTMTCFDWTGTVRPREPRQGLDMIAEGYYCCRAIGSFVFEAPFT
jgi:hypothetical protein